MILRPMNLDIAGERSFIAKSWVESFASSAMAKLLTFAGTHPKYEDREWHAGSTYWRLWNPVVDALLERARVTVADDGVIAGFMCWEPWEDTAAVHYIYTRLGWRDGAMGPHVARELMATLPAGPLLFTHRSRAVRGVPESWRYSLAPLFGVLERKEAA